MKDFVQMSQILDGVTQIAIAGDNIMSAGHYSIIQNIFPMDVIGKRCIGNLLV